MLSASACGFALGVIPKEGVTVAGSNSDNSCLSSRARSEQVEHGTCPEMDRMPQTSEPQNPVRTQENSIWTRCLRPQNPVRTQENSIASPNRTVTGA